MAIYHLETKAVSKGSAVAASAYLSYSRLYNDYDGIQHDYTRKQRLVWQGVFLPAMAPSEWKDREQLWNALEEAEKTKDSRLARELIVALPRELDRQMQIELLQEFIQQQFVADGMCAVAIHDPHPPGHNPHAHIMLTVHPLDEQGRWQYKIEKEYLCMKNSEEQLVAWRTAWADVSNRYLERAGHEERINHRSNAVRGLDEIPTIHEGSVARRLEAMELVSDRCEINRQIREQNKLIRAIRTEITKLTNAIMTSLPLQKLWKQPGRAFCCCVIHGSTIPARPKSSMSGFRRFSRTMSAVWRYGSCCGRNPSIKRR